MTGLLDQIPRQLGPLAQHHDWLTTTSCRQPDNLSLKHINTPETTNTAAHQAAASARNRAATAPHQPHSGIAYPHRLPTPLTHTAHPRPPAQQNADLTGYRKRFAKFGLELHPDKTRLIQFGRFAAERRAERRLGKPETFDYLGFTAHLCEDP